MLVPLRRLLGRLPGMSTKVRRARQHETSLWVRWMWTLVIVGPLVCPLRFLGRHRVMLQLMLKGFLQEQIGTIGWKRCRVLKRKHIDGRLYTLVLLTRSWSTAPKTVGLRPRRVLTMAPLKTVFPGAQLPGELGRRWRDKLFDVTTVTCWFRWVVVRMMRLFKRSTSLQLLKCGVTRMIRFAKLVRCRQHKGMKAFRLMQRGRLKWLS